LGITGIDHLLFTESASDTACLSHKQNFESKKVTFSLLWKHLYKADENGQGKLEKPMIRFIIPI